MFFKLPSMPLVSVLNVGPFAFGICFGGFVGDDIQAPTLACGFTPILWFEFFSLQVLHFTHCLIFLKLLIFCGHMKRTLFVYLNTMLHMHLGCFVFLVEILVYRIWQLLCFRYFEFIHNCRSKVVNPSFGQILYEIHVTFYKVSFHIPSYFKIRMSHNLGVSFTSSGPSCRRDVRQQFIFTFWAL